MHHCLNNVTFDPPSRSYHIECLFRKKKHKCHLCKILLGAEAENAKSRGRFVTFTLDFVQ